MPLALSKRKRSCSCCCGCTLFKHTGVAVGCTFSWCLTCRINACIHPFNASVCRGCDQPWRPTAHRHAHAWPFQRKYLFTRPRAQDFVQRRRRVRRIHDWLASLQQSKWLRCKLPAPDGAGGQRSGGEGTAWALQHIWSRKVVSPSFQLHLPSGILSQSVYLCHEIPCKHSASCHKFQRHFFLKVHFVWSVPLWKTKWPVKMLVQAKCSIH